MTDTETPQGATCILFALPEERKPFLAGLRLAGAKLLTNSPFAEQEAGTHPDYRLIALEFCGRKIITAVSRVGEKNASKLMATLAEAGGIDALMICGFAGGLSAEMAAGDLILSDSVARSSASHIRCFPDASLLDAAESLSTDECGKTLKMRTHLGLLVTAAAVLTSQKEKLSLAESTGGFAVDMETFSAVQTAQAHWIPWLAIRAITDPSNSALPLDFNKLADSKGNISYARVMLSLVIRPRKIPALIRLGRNSSLAAKNLSQFLIALLRRLPEIEE